MQFVTVMARRLGFKSIRVYLSGVRYFSLRAGHNFVLDQMHSLFYLLRGIRRTQGDLHTRNLRVPMTLPMLDQLFTFIQGHYPGSDTYMLQSAVTLAFFGLLRVSEFTAQNPYTYDSSYTLCFNNVFISTNLIIVQLRASKTDPFRMGVNIRIGVTGTRLCPVQALSRFHQVHPSRVGPLFVFSSGRFLARDDLVFLLRSCFPDLNVNTHSFRIGGASAAASAGIADSTIQILGRWSSDAYRRYIRIPDEQVMSWSRLISRSHSGSRVWDNDRLESRGHDSLGYVTWSYFLPPILCHVIVGSTHFLSDFVFTYCAHCPSDFVWVYVTAYIFAQCLCDLRGSV